MPNTADIAGLNTLTLTETARSRKRKNSCGRRRLPCLLRCSTEFMQARRATSDIVADGRARRGYG